MPEVLLVEDEPSVRDVLCRAFEQTGWTVFSAATPREARMLAKAHAVDLVVTDVMLPETNGFQLAEQIVKAQPQVPVIFMSGYAEKYLPARGHPLRPQDWLARHAVTGPFRLCDCVEVGRPPLRPLSLDCSPGHSLGNLHHRM